MDNWISFSQKTGSKALIQGEELLELVGQILKIHLELTQDALYLRTELVRLLNADLNSYTSQLEHTNAELLRQFQQQQETYTREINELHKSSIKLEGLVTHQHANLKQALQAGMVGKPGPEA